MKLPDIKDFVNIWPKSLPVLKNKVLEYFIKNNIQHDNIWFPDIETVFPKHLVTYKNIQIVFFGGFIERVFETGNWPEKEFTFWVLSSQVKKILEQMLNFPINSVAVIPRESLFSKSKELKYLDLNSDIQIVYSGRLSPQKNIEMILAFSSILQEKLKKNVDLLLLGEWDDFMPKSRGRYQIDSYAELINQFQQKLVFKNPPKFINNLNHNEWMKILAPNSLLVNFSTFVCEDFGVSIAQAQELGFPMLLSKWGGHLDVVADNSFGIDKEDIGESFTSDELITLKAQLVVDKFLNNKLIKMHRVSPVENIYEKQFIKLEQLHEIRSSAIKKHGDEISLLGRDRMQLFASSINGKRFFKTYFEIFSGKL